MADVNVSPVQHGNSDGRGEDEQARGQNGQDGLLEQQRQIEATRQSGAEFIVAAFHGGAAMELSQGCHLAMPVSCGFRRRRPWPIRRYMYFCRELGKAVELPPVPDIFDYLWLASPC